MVKRLSHQKVYVIVDKNKGSKVLQEAKKLGLIRGTIIKARGTIKDKFFNFLSLYDVEKEIIIMGVEKSSYRKLIDGLTERFNFNEKGHGILFSTRVEMYAGGKDRNIAGELDEEEVSVYKMITTIVEKGKGQDAVEFANEAGARGATIINARGSGTSETMKVFNMEIEPEKEIVMILVEKDIVGRIVDTLVDRLKLEEEGKGILFVQDIYEARGLYSGES